MKKGLFLICCFCLFLAGCSEDKEEIDAELELITAQVLGFSGPATAMIEFTSSSEWELEVNWNEDGFQKIIPDWLKLSRVSGESGNNRIIVRVSRLPSKQKMVTIRIKGSGKSELSVLLLLAAGPVGDRVVSDIVMYDENDKEIGNVNFVNRAISGDTVLHMYKLEVGNVKKITNWWSVDEVAYYDYEGGRLMCYVENRFECMDTVCRAAGNIIRTSVEKMTDYDLGKEGYERKKEYSYNREGNLVKISSSGSFPLIKGFVWNGKRLESIQDEGDVYDFSYTSAQWNNLNIDLFYFILYGLFGWDEDACLLQLTGLRAIHLPSHIKYKNESWDLRYERDAAGYIIYIFLDKKGGESYKWEILYH